MLNEERFCSVLNGEEQKIYGRPNASLYLGLHLYPVGWNKRSGSTKRFYSVLNRVE